MKFRLISMILVVLTCLSLTSCGKEDFIFRIGMDKIPINLDPQLATSDDEFLICGNLFSGLTKLNENGEAELNAALSYTVNEDYTEYVFKIDTDKKWNNGDKLTANDFVFAFRRAVMPETNSPYSNLLLNIINAKSVIQNELNSSELGVTAVDDSTLKISLNNSEKEFLMILTNPVFYPCNEEFFENSKGKYGLGKKLILTNGLYSINTWSSSGSLRLKKSENNNTINSPDIVAISEGTIDQISRLNNNDLDYTRVTQPVKYNDELSNYDNKFDYKSVHSIVFNMESDIGKNEYLRKTFSLIGFDNYENIVGNHCIYNYQFIPSNSNLLFNEYGISDLLRPQYDVVAAKNNLINSAKEYKNNSIPKIYILCLNDKVSLSILNSLQSFWSSIGLYVNIETVSSMEQLTNRIKTKNYSLAFVPLGQNNINCLDLLSQFTSDSDDNFTGYKNQNFDELYFASSNQTNFEQSRNFAIQAEQQILNDNCVIPIISIPYINLTNQRISKINFVNSNGFFDFSKLNLLNK